MDAVLNILLEEDGISSWFKEVLVAQGLLEGNILMKAEGLKEARSLRSGCAKSHTIATGKTGATPKH